MAGGGVTEGRIDWIAIVEETKLVIWMFKV